MAPSRWEKCRTAGIPAESGDALKPASAVPAPARGRGTRNRSIGSPGQAAPRSRRRPADRVSPRAAAARPPLRPAGRGRRNGIEAPLVDERAHVEEPVSVRASPARVPGSLERAVRDLAVGNLVAPGGPGSEETAARGVLPLRLRRQPPPVFRRARKPLAVRDRLVPGDSDDRLRGAREPRVLPPRRLGRAGRREKSLVLRPRCGSEAESELGLAGPGGHAHGRRDEKIFRSGIFRRGVVFRCGSDHGSMLPAPRRPSWSARAESYRHTRRNRADSRRGSHETPFQLARRGSGCGRHASRNRRKRWEPHQGGSR
jgi:hypothetical protein